MTAGDDLTLEALAEAADGAAADAIIELRAGGVSFYYRENGVDVREDPDGRRVQIEYTGLKRGAYRVVRELEAQPR